MKLGRVLTERWFHYDEGDCGKPIRNYYKKGYWKRHGRKKFLKRLEKWFTDKNKHHDR